jgi:hypothetical protein
MDKLGVLDGVDDISWADLQHAYGPADDVTELLQALLSGDADEALDELFSSLCHQGSVYSASVYAVPFLARIAAAGIGAAGVLGLLGCIAKSTNERALEVPGSARAAVAAQVDVLVSLLSDPDAEVRALTAWALAEGRSPDRLVPALRARWDAETSLVVRATILRALSVLDGAAGIAADVVAGPADAILRLVAAEACVAAGMRWSDELHDAATAWLAGGVRLPAFWWDDTIPFSNLLTALAARGDLGLAVGLAVTGLSKAVAAGVRKDAVRSVSRLAHDYRVPTSALAIPLAAVAGDEDAGVAAIMLLRDLAAGLPVGGQLADGPTAGGQLVAVADVRGPDRRADEALACLFDLGDPRAHRLLVRDLRDRPFALQAATLPVSNVQAPPPPFDPVLLEAVRERLRTWDMNGPRPDWLLALLSGWGLAAAPAIPELTGLVPWDPLAAGRALAAVGGAIPAAVEALRLAATTGLVLRRLDAAAALRSLTGEDEPLLAAIEYGLDRRHGGVWMEAARAARTLVSAPDRLIPALTAARDAVPPAIGVRIEVGLALWHYTGDAAAAVRLAAEALKAEPSGQRGAALWAAGAAAELGPAARPLVPAILPLLEDPRLCPVAAQAIVRIHPESPGGVPLAELADRLVTIVGNVPVVGDPGGIVNRRAVGALAAMGQTAGVPSAAREYLRHLAERDQRIIRWHIRSDEILRAEIRHLLEDLR